MRWLTFGTALICLLWLAGARAAGPGLSVYVDGRQVDYPAQEIDGKTYVPLDLVSGPLGHVVRRANNDVLITKDGDGPGRSVVLVVAPDDELSNVLAAGGIAVLRRSSLPPKLDPRVSCVVFITAAAVGPNTAANLKTFIGAGGGVVTTGRVPVALAGGRDLGSIREWFGAGEYYEVRPADMTLRVLHPESIGFKGQADSYYKVDNEDLLEIGGLDSKTVPLIINGNYFKYGLTHRYGEGRVVHLPVWRAKPDYPDPPALLVTAVKWAAQMR